MSITTKLFFVAVLFTVVVLLGTASAVYTCNIYVTRNVGFGYTVFNVNGYPAIRFAVNFPYNACISKIIFGWSWNLTGTLLNVTPDSAPYFHNLTIDFAHFGDLGVWTAGANVSIYEFASDKIAFVVWRDDSAVSRVLATHILPDVWSKILSRSIAYVALWLPNVTWQNIHVYVNGSLWDGYLTDCVSVLQLSDTPAICYDRNYHIVVLRLPMHSRYVVMIEEATAEVTPAPKPIEVTSVTLTFSKTEVRLSEPVTYTVTVQVNDTSWTGTLDYELVCTGPTTVKNTGTVSISGGTGTATRTVTFPEAGTYTCYVIVNGKESNTVRIDVVGGKHVGYPIYIPIILLIFAVITVLVIVHELEKKKRNIGREIIVRF